MCGIAAQLMEWMLFTAFQQLVLSCTFCLILFYQTNLPPVDNPGLSMATCLQYLGQDILFSRELVQWIVDVPQNYHCEQAKSSKQTIVLKKVNIVIAKVAIQSNSKKELAPKLVVYQSCRNFTINTNKSLDVY